MRIRFIAVIMIMALSVISMSAVLLSFIYMQKLGVFPVVLLTGAENYEYGNDG